MLTMTDGNLKKRRIIPPELRKKVSTACDSCKRRKHKCSGGQPCVWCSNKGTECEFTMIDKRSLKAERMARLKELSALSETAMSDTFHTGDEMNLKLLDLHLIDLKLNMNDDGDRLIHLKLVNDDGHMINLISMHMENPMESHMNGYSMNNSHLDNIHQNIHINIHGDMRGSQLDHDHHVNNNIQISHNTHDDHTHDTHFHNTHNIENAHETHNLNNNINSNAIILHKDAQNPHTQNNFRSSEEEERIELARRLNHKLLALVRILKMHSEQNPRMGLPLCLDGFGLDVSSTYGSASSSTKRHIPKSLEILLSQPGEILPTESTVQTAGNADIILLDSTGTAKCLGPTGPGALLIETKLLFHLQGLKIADEFPRSSSIDRPIEPNEKNRIFLPDRDASIEYAALFNLNVNDISYVIDFRQLIDEVLEVALEDAQSDERTILLLVISLGARYKRTQAVKERVYARQYFETGLFLLRERGGELAGHWMVIYHYLCYFYYLSVDKQLTAWMSLNTAIKYAQAFGFHRTNVVNQMDSEASIVHTHKLFRSLYISDRSASTYLGRPYAINDNDWQDREYSSGSFKEMAQINLCKLGYIAGQVSLDLYKYSTASMTQIRSLVSELKLWCAELDPSLSLQLLIDQPATDAHVLLQLHLFHLYTVNLLGRPLYMHVSKMKMQLKPDIDIEILHFHGATLKAAILSVRIVRVYLDNAERDSHRIACDVIVPCFVSCLTICTAILTETAEPEEIISEWSATVRVGMDILRYFAEAGSLAMRLLRILQDIIGVLDARNKKAEEISPETLHSLLAFQRYFVPEIKTHSQDSPYQ